MEKYIYSLKGNLRKQVEQDYEAGGTDGKMEQTDGKILFLKKNSICKAIATFNECFNARELRHQNIHNKATNSYI